MSAVVAGSPADLTDLDDSLEASHKRMRYALAVQSHRIETQAKEGGLTTLAIEQLAVLSNTWRTLTQNQPAPDLSEMSVDELKAKLAAVKARGK